MKQDLTSKIKGGLIASVQANKGEPLYTRPSIMPLMALAVKQAGAAALRVNGVDEIKAIKKLVNLPIFGIIKKEYKGYPQYITPTMKEIDALAKAKVEVIALDCTPGPRIGFDSIEAFINAIKKKYPKQLLMADISTYQEAIEISKLGVDYISNTLSGYTKQSKKNEGPAFDLIKKLGARFKDKFIAEGRIHYPEQARRALNYGALAVCVGGAITRPYEIASRFVKTMKK
jgi:N-acylglucosamine-6-phosphate 2-epimerase